jgi:hypothetical protein
VRLCVRYLQASLLLPLYQKNCDTPPRALPIQFEQLPHFKKPKKKAPQEQRDEYKKLKLTFNTSTCYVEQFNHLRSELDKERWQHKTLLSVCGGSFCNRTCFTADIERIEVIVRTRKNARLYLRNQDSKSRRLYCAEGLLLRTYAKIRKCLDILRGKVPGIRFKEINEVYWKNGTKRKPLRLIVIAPTPYDKRDH